MVLYAIEHLHPTFLAICFRVPDVKMSSFLPTAGLLFDDK